MLRFVISDVDSALDVFYHVVSRADVVSRLNVVSRVDAVWYQITLDPFFVFSPSNIQWN